MKAMDETATIPRAECERLCAVEEEFADIRAALAVEAGIANGTDELVPAPVADRPIDREPPLRIWREYRALSQAALARACGVDRAQIVGIEAGRKTGSVHTLRKSAEALGVAVDDLLPG